MSIFKPELLYNGSNKHLKKWIFKSCIIIMFIILIFSMSQARTKLVVFIGLYDIILSHAIYTRSTTLQLFSILHFNTNGQSNQNHLSNISHLRHVLRFLEPIETLGETTLTRQKTTYSVMKSNFSKSSKELILNNCIYF